MKVRCHNTQKRKYLTDGKVYDVVSQEGDQSKRFPSGKVWDGAFEIKADDGVFAYCLFNGCAHADWEVVE